MSQTVLEVSKDILVAILSQSNSLTSGSADDIKRKVTEAFSEIYDTVKRKSGGG